MENDNVKLKMEESNLQNKKIDIKIKLIATVLILWSIWMFYAIFSFGYVGPSELIGISGAVLMVSGGLLVYFDNKKGIFLMFIGAFWVILGTTIYTIFNSQIIPFNL